MDFPRRRFFSSLWAKSVLFLGLILLAIFALITFINVHLQSRLIYSRQVNNAVRVKELVLSAMRYPMLSGDQDVIQKQFDEYGRRLPGLRSIDLADGAGVVRRSTMKGHLSHPLGDIESRDPAMPVGPEREFMGVLKEDGQKIFALRVPIFNEGNCHACHGTTERVLGTLHLELDWETVIEGLRASRDMNILVSILGILLISVLTILFLFRSIFRPLKRMYSGMQKVAEGDFSTNLSVLGSDEISLLSTMFNKMSGDLSELIRKENALLAEAEAREQNLMSLNSQLEEESAERLRVQQALTESERRFRTLIENLNVGVYRSLLGPEGTFLELNPALVKILGFDSAAELRKTSLRACYAEVSQRDELIRRVREFGAVWNYEVQMRRKDGQVVWVSINARGTFGDDGELAWIDGMMEDITGRKLAEEKLRTAHRQMEDIIEFFPDPVFVLDRQHRVIAWNLAMERMTGIAKPDILGKGEYRYAVPFYGKPVPVFVDSLLDGERPAAWYQNVSRGNNFFHGDCFVPNLNNGQGAYMSLNASLLFSAEGEVIGAIETLRDVTERTEFIKKIEHAAYEWRSTFDCIPELVALLEPDFRIGRVNKAFADAVESLPEALIGRECAGLANEFLCRWVVDSHRQVMAEGRPLMRDVFDTKSGRDMEITSAPVYDETRTITGVVHILKDVSERKELEKRQRLAQLGKLVADMAHEVNNPLMIISGNAQLSLMEDITNPEVRHNLEVIIDESRRAKDIIQRLLKFSRPSKGEFLSVDIGKVVDNIIALVEHQFSLANVAIVRDYGEFPCRISVDEKQIQEVFLNLLNNSKDAMQSGGTITIRFRPEGEKLRIEVADTGSGMNEVVLKHLMEPFFTTKTNGTGLGLSVTYGIIKSHGGEIRFESVPGQGTTAILLLPIKGGSDGATDPGR